MKKDLFNLRDNFIDELLQWIDHESRYDKFWYKQVSGYNSKRNSKKALYSSNRVKLLFCEETRLDPQNNKLLQVRCKNSNCRKWFNPTYCEVKNRLQAIKGQLALGAECNFYCSEECKEECVLYGASLYPKGFKVDRSRPVQSEWANLVKERDEYQCVKCGETNNLEAHHIEGINENPLMSADVDLGITLCENCHDEEHKKPGCRRIDMRCKNEL